jgi:K+-sensing histidine kinase KdpD
MAAVAFALASLVAAVLVVREIMWQRTAAELRARLEDRSAELREHARHTHVSQVVSGLAQELKSPLQGVLGNTELMLASATLHPASAADLRQIQEDAARAAGIVRNLLAFTETNALTRRWQDINELVTRAAETARIDPAGARLTVTLALAERLPLIYVDGRQLEKVIAALLSRAPQDAGAGAPAPVMVTTSLAAGGEWLVIELDDLATDGDEPAWSGDLAACRQVVQAHGGSLEVAPGGGAGFRFHLELPVAAVGVAPATT